jgi:tetratricopeptide (TPR) repeat protein
MRKSYRWLPGTGVGRPVLAGTWLRTATSRATNLEVPAKAICKFTGGLARQREVTGSEARAPKVFVSYSWDDEEHRGWVHDFAARLRADGVDAKLDQWEVHLGDPLPEFMERAVRENDFVLVICTPKYKERSDGRVGGVGYEGDIMTAEVFSTRDHRKFIPVLRRGGWSSAFPSWLRGKASVDLRRDPYSEEQYGRLLDTLYGETPQRPPLGSRPSRLAGQTETEIEAVSNMSPGIRPGQLPPFHELDEYTFQDLCRDIFDAEPSVATCEVYGTRGQAQHGIDLLAHRADGNGIEVGQCKRYENFTPRQIERVREEFFEHYGSHWQRRNVKRFILFVAGDLSSTQHQDKILEERDLFAAFGIRYEVWSAAQIRNKLRPRFDIVSTYLQPAEHWVQVICGVNLPAAHPAPAMQSLAMDWVNAALWERLERRESEEAERRLEGMREAWREGRRREAVSLLEALKADTATWEAVSPGTKAKVLRFEAGARLHISGDIDWAKRLADEARALSPSDDETRVRALIARAETGPGAAAELLARHRDADSLNLRASLLLEQGDFEGFRRALEALPEDQQQEPNAESAQLRALRYLLDKEVDRARLEAEKASELAPGWESVRFTAGVTNYMGALSPAALPNYLVGWPEPVDWALVKRDDESLARLRSATETFRGLVEGAEDEDDRQRYEAWLLASLANDPEGQEEAAAYCRQLLEGDPSHHRVVLWAVARSFDADLTSSETRLRVMVGEGSAELPHVLALSTLLMADRRAGEATDLLGETRSMFEAAGAVSLWTSWHAQSLALGGDPHGAFRELDASDPGGELRRVRTVALGIRAEQTGDWSEVLGHLERSYEETADPRFLFDACEIKESQEDWAYVADRAERLVDELGTAEALRLAAVGAYNDRRFELCMQLLDGRRDVLPGGKLTRELRQVRLGCQHSLGLLPEAAREAERLDREEPTIASGLNRLVVRFSLGDRLGVVLAARELAQRAGLTDEQALGVAELVRLDDPNLARTLWRRAVQGNLPNELVTRALNLGYGLGLEREVRPLAARAMELARRGEGGLQAMNLQEALEFIEQRHESQNAFQQMYLDGIAPIHFAPEVVGGSLASAYHRRLVENEAAGTPAESPFLLVGHGGRANVEVQSSTLTGGRLILDVTAVLLAEHLGILDRVEEAFDNLCVPWELMQTLVRMRDQAYPHQPARRDLLERVVQMADEGRLVEESIELPAGYENTRLAEEMGASWVAAFEITRAREGYLVDFLPLTTQTDLGSAATALPEDASKNLVNAGSVLEALRVHGPLSEDRAAEIREALGEHGHAYPGHPVPDTGSYLFLNGGIAETLASAGLLEAACNRFRVHVGAQELLRLRAEVRAFETAVEDAEWLEGLIDRLRQGLESGVYGTVVAPTDDARDSLRSSDDPTVHSLDTVLRFEPHGGDAIWIDDRAVNKYRSRDGVPTVGIYDVLRALRASEAIEEEEYYSALIKLRASNARYLPIEKEEILYHLGQARVADGQVVETAELHILRRYAAACLLRGDILHRPTTHVGDVVADAGELPFVVQLSRAVTEALTQPWEAEADERLGHVQAEWLLANMYLGYAGLTNVIELPGSGQDERPKVAFDLTDLIVRAIAVPSGTPAERLARRRRLRWLEARVLSRRFAADPGLLPMTAAEVKDSILEVRQGVARQAPEPVVAATLGKLYRDLPRSIHDELSRDPDFMAAVGMRTEIRMQIGPFQFGSEEFWRAATEAVNGRPASVATAEDQPITVMLRATEEPATLTLVDPATGDEPTVTHRYIPLLSESAAAREAALRGNRSWFDCPDAEFEAAVADIASLTDPLRRVEQAERWRDSSTAAFYEDLGDKLVGTDPLYLNELLPPDAERLLEHLRLGGESGPGSGFGEEAERAAGQLVREEGLMAALRRFAGLPVPLPPALLGAVRALPAEEQRELVHRMVGSSGSPVSKLHLIRLLVHLGADAAYLRLAGWVARALLCERGAEEYRAFSAILRWVSDEFDFRPDTKVLPAHVRLAAVWYHAHRLFALFAAAGAPFEHLRGEFDLPDKRVTSEVFEREAAYWQDVCHPRRADRVSFVHMGLAYAFSPQTERVDHAALRRVGGEDRARLLLRDTSRARDGLGSFLGGDRGRALSGLLPQEEADALRSSSLERLVAEAVENLADEERRGWAWAILFHVLGDQPPPEDLRERMKEALSVIDLAELVCEDAPTGLAILRAASLQAVNLGDEAVRSRLKDRLEDSARHFAEEGRREGGGEIDVRAPEQQAELRSLIESAVHLSAAVEGDGAFADFADLLSRLTDAWPAAAAYNKLVALRMCEELEAAKIRPFWRVLSRLRAQ